METVKVKGMSCQHCVMAVTKELSKIPGIKDVKVDLNKGEAVFENTQNASRETIRKAVEEAGFQVAE